MDLIAAVGGEDVRMKNKSCTICGRNDSGELTLDEKRRCLTQRDIVLTHCSNCGACVCGFCNSLAVCCTDYVEDEEGKGK